MTDQLYIGCSGVDVLQWQNFLFSKGFLKIDECDMQYGQRTATATEAWQRSEGLLDDGIVGKISRSRAFPATVKSALKESSKHRVGRIAEKALEFGFALEGLKEDGNNRGKLIDKWNEDLGVAKGSPWCVSFPQQMWKLAAEFFKTPDILKPDTASVFYLWNHIPDSWKIPADKGQRGDLGVMAISHLVMCVANCGDGYYETLEGNTGKAGEREGKYVRHKTKANGEARKCSQFLGWIRVPEEIKA